MGQDLPGPSDLWLRLQMAVGGVAMMAPACWARVNMAEWLMKGSRQRLSLDRIRTVSRQASRQDG